MFSSKVILLLVVILSIVIVFTKASPLVLVEENDEPKVRSKRFLFNLLPFGLNNPFNNEDYQVAVFRQQQRVLARVNPGFNQAYSHQQPFSPANDDWYLQGQLQQRRVRQKYFDATGERFSWNNFDDYNNPRFRNNYNY